MRVCTICRRCYDDQILSCAQEDHPPLSELRSGNCELITGYHLDLLLDSGIKGEQYAAHHIESGRPCQIKILLAKKEDSEQFLRDAQIAAALFHPSVADVYDLGTLPTSEMFVVTEDAGGQSLRELLNTGGVPQLLTSIQIVRQAAEALHAIHLKGLTHRAISPENIILTTDPERRTLVRLKNLDLGGVNERSILSNKFLIDTAIDSLKYFSPEQCTGKAVGMKTDVYSLGVVLYEMLAGVPPFNAPKATELIEKHRNERPPEIRIDDFELRMLVTHTLMESLRKLPEKRQSSANAFARQLRHIEQLATHVSTPPPAGVISPSPSRTIAAVAAAAGPQFADIRPSAIVGKPIAIFEDKAESVAAITLKNSDDGLPKLPPVRPMEPAIENAAGVIEPVPLELESVLPAVENQVRKASTPIRPGRSRLKLLRKKLHSKLESEIAESKMLPNTQPAPPTSVQIQALSVGIASVAVRTTPAKIEWEQPEDDIPSEADVHAVLSEEHITPIQIVPSEPDVPHHSVSVAPVKIEWEQPEGDIPSEAEVLEVLSGEQIMEVAPQTEASASAQSEPEEISSAINEEEITQISPPRRLIRIDWEKVAASQGCFPVQASSPLLSDELTFVPTILGSDRRSKSIEPEREGSILSAYYPSSPSSYSVPYRSILIGGGIFGLIALLLFGSEVVGRFASTGTSGDTVAAETTPATETRPPAAIANAVSGTTKKSLKYFDKPKAGDDDANANQSKPEAVNDRTRLSNQRRPIAAAKNEAKTAQAPSTIVIFTENGKTKSRIEPQNGSTNKMPLSIAKKTAGATRPRVVKEP